MPDPLVLPRLPRRRGTVARSSTWWGRAFLRSVEEAAYDVDDVAAGRALARSGRLGAVVVLASLASVVVDPDHDQALLVQLKVGSLANWPGFVEELVGEAGFLAELEAGQLPQDLLEHADEVGAELLPAAGDLETACECDAWTQPCPHALALLHRLAWGIDADPYVLLLLRGRSREWILGQVEAQEQEPESRDAGERARRILALADNAPTGAGFADVAVARYDEQITRLL